MGTDFGCSIVKASAKAIYKRNKTRSEERELLPRIVNELWTEHKPVVLRAAEEGETIFTMPFRNARGNFKVFSPTKNDIEESLPDDLKPDTNSHYDAYGTFKGTVKPNGDTSKHLIGFNIVVDCSSSANVLAAEFEGHCNPGSPTRSELEETNNLF